MLNQQKELPILFSGEMVEAILNGWKTQTRRVRGLKDINKKPSDWFYLGLKETPRCVMAQFQHHDTGEVKYIKCGYGMPGAQLYVRETWARCYDYIIHKAGAENNILPNGCACAIDDLKWRPSIHIKKGNARIWLEVKSIGIERLCDISKDDAMAEGIRRVEAEHVLLQEGDDASKYPVFYCYPIKDAPNGYGPHNGIMNVADSYIGDDFGPNDFSDAKYSFQSLWKTIHGWDSWAKNPWVWAVKFKVSHKADQPQKDIDVMNQAANEARAKKHHTYKTNTKNGRSTGRLKTLDAVWD